MCARGRRGFDRGGEFERGGGFDWEWSWGAWCGPGQGPPRGFGPGFRRGGRRGRMFDRGDLKYVILRLLARKPMHGYEVMRELEERSGGWYSASAGSVYPVLQMLQDQGYVTSEEIDGRRVYSITDEGRAFLERHSERADDVLGRVATFAGRFSSGEMESIARSFMRLARESFEHAMRVADDPEAAARLREVLDRAVEELRALRDDPRRGAAGGTSRETEGGPTRDAEAEEKGDDDA